MSSIGDFKPASHESPSTDRYLSRKEAARYLLETYGAAAAVSATTLAKLASIGGGPEFRRFGRRVGYTTKALDAFAMGRMSGPLTQTRTPDYRAHEIAPVSSPKATAMANSQSPSAQLG